MNILIIGDICEDVFIFGDCERLNPEAPTPIFTPNGEQKSNLGMAGNVFYNLTSLRPSWDVKLHYINQTMIRKTRYVDKKSNYILLRIDSGSKYTQISHTLLFNSITNTKLDGIVISDYDKGLLSPSDIETICIFARKYNIPTFLDTKKKLENSWAKYVDFIKINEKEFNENVGGDNICSGISLEGCSLITTLGDKGCRINAFDGINQTGMVIPAKKINVRDVTGCGDTFLSAFASIIIEEWKNKITLDTVKKACEYANAASAVAASKSGVVIVRPDEIIF